MSLSFPLALELVAGCLLLLISYQDWQTRSVSWPAFPLLAGCLLTSHLLREPCALVCWQSGCNLLLLALLLTTLVLYVQVRFRAGRLRLRDCLGSGDILFWLTLAGYLSPPDLLLFLLGSSLVGLLLVGLRVVRPLPNHTTMTVPLAGIQAACLLALLAGRWLLPDWFLWPALAY
jgi:hypothetical protein